MDAEMYELVAAGVYTHVSFRDQAGVCRLGEVDEDWLFYCRWHGAQRWATCL